MKIHVFNSDFVHIGILLTYMSLIWNEDYQNYDSFILHARDTAQSVELLRNGNFLVPDGKDTSGIITEVVTDSRERTIMAMGYTSGYLLEQRIIMTTNNTVNAIDGMRNIVSNNLRGVDDIVVDNTGNYDDVFEIQHTYTTLPEAINEICVGSGLGWRMRFDLPNKKHVFEVYKGVDRRYTQTTNVQAVFSDELRNLYNIVIDDDNTFFKNVAIVAGAGEGANRKVIEVGNATGKDRHELFVDARDLQPEGSETVNSPAYINRLTNRGVSKLNDYIRRQSFEIDIDYNDFGIRYSLGDYISCRSQKYDVLLSVRIQKYTDVVENNTKTTSLTLGAPRLDALGAEKLK